MGCQVTKNALWLDQRWEILFDKTMVEKARRSGGAHGGLASI